MSILLVADLLKELEDDTIIFDEIPNNKTNTNTNIIFDNNDYIDDINGYIDDLLDGANVENVLMGVNYAIIGHKCNFSIASRQNILSQFDEHLFVKRLLISVIEKISSSLNYNLLKILEHSKIFQMINTVNKNIIIDSVFDILNKHFMNNPNYVVYIFDFLLDHQIIRNKHINMWCAKYKHKINKYTNKKSQKYKKKNKHLCSFINNEIYDYLSIKFQNCH